MSNELRDAIAKAVRRSAEYGTASPGVRQAILDIEAAFKSSADGRVLGLREAAEHLLNPGRPHGAWTNRTTAAEEILKLAEGAEK